MEVPRHWRIKKQRYSLIGEVCPRCETKVFPPKAACPVCSGDLIISDLSFNQVGAVDVSVLKTPLKVGMKEPVL